MQNFALYRLMNIERRGRTIYLVTRNDDLNRVIFEITDFFPYCFIKHGLDVPFRLRNLVAKRIVGSWKTLYGEAVDKIICNNPDSVRSLRDGMKNNETFEADIIYTTRFLIDTKIRSGYFTLRGGKKGVRARSGHMKIIQDDIIPIDPPFHIPAREFELDIESVEDKTVLIGFWDSFLNRYYSVIWNKRGSGTLNDQYISWNKEGKKTKQNLPIERIRFAVPNMTQMYNTIFRLWKNLQPDVISGWNVVGYDIPEMFEKSFSCGIDIAEISPFNSAPAPEKIKGLVIFDQLDGFKMMEARKLRSYRLPNVIKSVFKVDVPHDPKRIPEMYHTDPKALVDYNNSHVDACRLISKELDVIEFTYQKVYSCCCRFDDVESPLRLVDSLMLSLKDKNIVYPNKLIGGKKNKEKAKGAKVFDPVVGRTFKYLLIFDLSRLYPTIMYWMNMGDETLDPNGNIKIVLRDENYSPIQTVRFTDKKKSELSKLFDVLFALRDKYEDELKVLVKDGVERNIDQIKIKKQQIFSTKINTNAAYGALGNQWFRLFSKITQECVTQVGRDVIEHFSDVSYDYSNDVLGIESKVIYGDTDSCVLHIQVDSLSKAIKYGKKIGKIINKSFDKFAQSYGVKEHGFNVKMEGIASSGLFKTKKRYALKLVWEDDVILEKPRYKIVGLEPKRSDSPEITDKTMTKVIKKILSKKSLSNIEEYVNNTYSDIINGEYTPFEIGIPKGLNHPMKYYFRGKCRKCGRAYEGFCPFTEKSSYDNRLLYCPACDNKLTYGRPIHAFAADYSNTYLDAGLGEMSKVRYLYVSDTGKFPETHVIAIDEDSVLSDEIQIDLEMQAKKILSDKINPLVELIGGEKEVKPKKTKQKTLSIEQLSRGEVK